MTGAYEFAPFCIPVRVAAEMGTLRRDCNHAVVCLPNKPGCDLLPAHLPCIGSVLVKDNFPRRIEVQIRNICNVDPAGLSAPRFAMRHKRVDGRKCACGHADKGPDPEYQG